jgi:thymidylate synthase
MLKYALNNNKYRHGIDSLTNGEKHEENQYLNLIDDIINENNEFVGRNGSTLAVFGCAMHFTLNNNIVPFLTTKKLAWKTCIKELLWFIKGDTSNIRLKEQNVKIWNANGSRTFLNSRGLTNNKEDDLGPIYGFQWRHFNADYDNCDTDYTDKGVDQLKYIIDQLKNPETRNSRRLIMTAWNPCQINEMALPPCHILCQFNVSNGNKLSCAMYQRSGDVGLGVPFNIASYSILTRLIAHHTGLMADEFVYYLGNTHIYHDHINNLKVQKARTPYTFPALYILNTHKNIEDYTIDDFELKNYKYHENINLIMRE